MASNPPIAIAGLNHWFGTGEARKQALFDIDLTIEQGTAHRAGWRVRIGQKTTLLTLIGCLRQVQDGSVRLLGRELRGATEETLVASRRQLGFIFQAHNLHDSLTAMQNVRMGLEVHGPRAWPTGSGPPGTC